MCKFKAVLGICYNEGNCKYAHKINEINIKYHPYNWVKHFEKISSSQLGKI